MSKVWWFVTCAAVAITLAPRTARAESGFVHTSRAITTCVIANTPTHTRIRDSKTQYNVAFNWTYRRGVGSWTMSPWVPTADFAQHAGAAVLQGAPPAGPGGIQHTSISYTTKLRLPRVLSSLIDTDQTVRVQKTLYAVGDRIYSFVKIVDVPFLQSIYIDTVMTFYGNRRVVSLHEIRYSQFPWMLSWATSVLKREIIKSLERIDMLSEQMYCPA